MREKVRKVPTLMVGDIVGTLATMSSTRDSTSVFILGVIPAYLCSSHSVRPYKDGT